MSVHINAKQGDIAESVLLPGDPLRAKFIAETFLENPFVIMMLEECMDIQEHIKEREYQFKEQEWVSLQFQYMLMS